jgi:hypothetical protein
VRAEEIRAAIPPLFLYKGNVENVVEKWKGKWIKIEEKRERRSEVW